MTEFRSPSQIEARRLYQQFKADRDSIHAGAIRALGVTDAPVQQASDWYSVAAGIAYVLAKLRNLLHDADRARLDDL